MDGNRFDTLIRNMAKDRGRGQVLRSRLGRRLGAMILWLFRLPPPQLNRPLAGSHSKLPR